MPGNASVATNAHLRNRPNRGWVTLDPAAVYSDLPSRLLDRRRKREDNAPCLSGRCRFGGAFRVAVQHVDANTCGRRQRPALASSSILHAARLGRSWRPHQGGRMAEAPAPEKTAKPIVPFLKIP